MSDERVIRAIQIRGMIIVPLEGIVMGSGGGSNSGGGLVRKDGGNTGEVIYVDLSGLGESEVKE